MKKRTIVVLFLIIGLLLSGCTIFQNRQEKNPLSQDQKNTTEDEKKDKEKEITNTQPEETRKVTLYYKDSGGYIVPVVRTMPKVESIAKSALLALVDNAENRKDLKALGLQPVLPANTQIELAIKEDGLIRVNFSKEILNVESKVEEQNMVKAIVYSLTEFENIDKVQLLVDNKIRETLTYGTEIREPITRGNINSMNNTIEGEQAKLTLYMYNHPTDQYTYFVPITKNIPASAKNVETAIQELIETKGEIADLELDIPEGTKLYGVDVESGIAYVHFSEHLLQITDKGKLSNLTKAIGLTLKEFGGIDGVNLVIDGENNNINSETVAVPTFANTY
ncbi:GerMN domain-containing protein [Garciella nitratireducens]|uniref:GerMN domain-containing protein n=1 Tax=Garciella nitratireducens TaxID=218205 RepID=UPI001BD3E24F|nr:GerMN domain-containing protein [Garciella nitratireducens]